MYEVFDHTADLGLRIRAPDLASLFAEAGKALFSVIVENLEAVELREVRKIHLQSENLEYLLFDWLDQLLYLFDAQKLVLADFRTEVLTGEQEEQITEGQAGKSSRSFSETGNSSSRWELKAEVRGEILDRERHILDHEVKAITYHGLKVEKTVEGWLAEVIVDI
jgi:SHS2 domain-containing protein